MLSADDRYEIRDLVSKYAHFSDFGDWHGMSGLCLPSVVTDISSLGARYEGIEALIDHAKEFDREGGGRTRHYHLNLYISEEGDQVVANYYFLKTDSGTLPLTAQIVLSGRERDTVVRTPDGWKIARRDFILDQKWVEKAD